ncbi:VIT1/CCC1 family predicted Fe2+/Mn2+ transporter [Hydrogenispora ethanolica]|uniref:VIT1/CCC1 family predicted Fe2+/Mn2+ transporter n=1 Tax=Hydrogenispora ethanolica TaxID=1082276 RepID=A0A4V2QBU2_HYDET|nr:VIT1/CCC1 family protein [Hydrogenispora ethanolica]TCL57702.1 VIT1/CCC1 family predicted Fe2+/Mn2+ transporter [Hydrogenispora ethanolica]
MVSDTEVRRYRENLQAEREAIALYERLAAAEPNPDLADIYRRLVATEQKHAAFWEGKLRAAGREVPGFKAGWRTRVFGWLAGRMGPAFVLPAIASLERTAAGGYNGQADAEAANMPAEERSHARIFGQLARTTQGMQGSELARFEGRHRATGGNALRAAVLGANDGLLSVFNLVMGVAGAGVPGRSILITGVAGMLAGALSMALGEWLSVQSSRELYQHQLEIEERELEEVPEEEVEELTLIYQAKGIEEATARQLAGRLVSDPATALDTLAREELAIDPAELGGSAWEAAITSFLLFAVGAIIPVLPYLFFTGVAGILVSAVCSAAGLFALGAFITVMTGKHPLLSGLRQVLFGLATAAITFGIGRLIGVNLG